MKEGLGVQWIFANIHGANECGKRGIKTASLPCVSLCAQMFVVLYCAQGIDLCL